MGATKWQQVFGASQTVADNERAPGYVRDAAKFEDHAGEELLAKNGTKQ